MQVQLNNVTVSYNKKPALSNVYLQLHSGKMYGIIGPNGAGKSTLFKSMLGLIQPDSGSILYDDNSIAEVRKKVVYVPQKNDIDTSFPATVFDVVIMGRLPHKSVFQTYNSDDKRIVEENLQLLEIADFKHKQISQLSGGQLQRVFIARALCQQAEVYFLDEPLVGVDMKTEEKVIDILKLLRNKGKTIFMIHHDMTDVESYFDDVIMINNRIVAYGAVNQVFTSENIRKTFHSHHNLFHESLFLPK